VAFIARFDRLPGFKGQVEFSLLLVDEGVEEGRQRQSTRERDEKNLEANAAQIVPVVEEKN